MKNQDNNPNSVSDFVDKAYSAEESKELFSDDMTAYEEELFDYDGGDLDGESTSIAEDEYELEEVIVYHHDGDSAEYDMSLHGRPLHARLEWSECSSGSMAVIDRDHVVFHLPLDWSVDDLFEYVFEMSDQIERAIEMSLLGFGEVQTSMEAAQGEIVQILGVGYPVDYLEGEPRCELTDMEYIVYGPDPHNVEAMHETMMRDLFERLHSILISTQEDFMRVIEERPHEQYEIRYALDQDAPAITYIERGYISVNPKLIQFSRDYIEYVAVRSIADLITQGDTALSLLMMDRYMPDWNERFDI